MNILTKTVSSFILSPPFLHFLTGNDILFEKFVNMTHKNGAPNWGGFWSVRLIGGWE